MSSSIEERINVLQEEINKAERSLDKKKISTPVIIAIAVPFVVAVLLLILAPSFVKRKEGGKYVRCGKKIFQWTIIFTVILWLGLYLYMYCAYGKDM